MLVMFLNEIEVNKPEQNIDIERAASTGSVSMGLFYNLQPTSRFADIHCCIFLACCYDPKTDGL